MTPADLAKSGTESGHQRICIDCCKVAALPEFQRCEVCKTKRYNQNAAYKARMKETGVCTRCGERHARGKMLCDICAGMQMDRAKEIRKRNKLAIVAHFGGKCCECGESDIRTLTLDHIDNDGNVKAASKNGKRMHTTAWYAKLYLRIVKNSPMVERLQLLCFNCHAKKDLTPWWFNDA